MTLPGNGLATIVALIPDVFFSVTVRNVARRCGFEPVVVTTITDAINVVRESTVALLIVDITAIPDVAAWSQLDTVSGSGTPVLAFGPHRDVDGLRRAKAANVSRVVANSQFHREMSDLIARYARSGDDA